MIIIFQNIKTERNFVFYIMAANDTQSAQNELGF